MTRTTVDIAWEAGRMTVRSGRQAALAVAVTSTAVAAVLSLAGCRAAEPASDPASDPAAGPTAGPVTGPAGDPTAGAAGPSAGPAGHPAAGPAGTPWWAWELPHCVAYRPADYRAPAHRLTVEVRPGPDTIAYVETYEPGWGSRAMAEIRALLRECGRYESGGSGDPAAFSDQHLITEPEFTGDEALLVETTRLRPPDHRTWYSLVIRNGDVVTTIRTGSPPEKTGGCRDATCPAGRA